MKSLENVLDNIKRYRERLIDLLIKMISIPTISPAGDYYEEFINFMKDHLEREGFDIDIIRVPQDYVDKNVPREGVGKPRFIMIARYGDKRNIILHFNGHYDVVPGGPGWSVTDPFKPVVREERVYGRGSTDMKGGIASVIHAVSNMTRYLEENGYGVEIALVPDEEIGGRTGSEYLVSTGRVGSRYVIIAEPSGLERIYIGHKGSVWGRIIVKGKTAHGSTPWLGVNAFEKAVELAYEIINKIIPETIKIKSSYEYDLPEGNTATLMLGGFLKGGEKTNQVPGEVIFSFDRRVIVEEKASKVYEELKRKIFDIAKTKNIDIDIEIEQISEPVLVDPESLIFKVIENAGEKILGKRPRKIVCIGGLDMRFYAEKNYEVATYGPGAIGTAHAPDEYVEIKDLVKASEIYTLIIDELAKKISRT
jgi:succinyl-diaminopimelate desuccinylase